MARESKVLIALAHHWLISERGGEKVLHSMAKLFPEADIHTLVAAENAPAAMPFLMSHVLRPSVLQKFPAAARHYKKLLPLFPLATRSMRVASDCRLVLSSDASVIKGLQIPDPAIHVCYCHSPPRYLWEMQEIYTKQSSQLGFLGRLAFNLTVPYVRRFDQQAAQKVDHFIANSNFVAERIHRCYGRSAKVIYPPVALDDFVFSENKDDSYLIVSELVPYKRIDLAVEAFNRNGRRLQIIGEGSEREALQARAAANIEFRGRVPLPQLREAYARARALIFPGIEDFGITPLEAQASGTPVIALGMGGALETVVNGETGLFFNEPTTKSLNQAIEGFESQTFASEACRQQAERFCEPRFQQAMKAYLTEIAPGIMTDQEA